MTDMYIHYVVSTMNGAMFGPSTWMEKQEVHKLYCKASFFKKILDLNLTQVPIQNHKYRQVSGFYLTVNANDKNLYRKLSNQEKDIDEIQY